MSDIRFNRWLHQSGTGGVSQDSSGNIGIGTTVPTMALDVRGDVNIGNTININNASGIISATTFTGTTGTFSGNVSAVDATFTGNVTIGGTLTYEDVANIDAVGIITAQSDIIVGGGLTVTGISTFNNDIKLLDNDKLNFGIGEDLQIYHDGSASYIHEQGTGDLNLCVGHAGSKFVIQSGTSGGHLAEFNYNGAAELFYSGNQKLETTNTGAVVTGILTATTFSGNLTGNVTGDLTGNLAGISSIAAISSSISDTAVDVFVYDTRKDSDGGAWRKRTQHTSWYNETLNTSTRGSRKEFPAVAVIVAETTKVTIYDGDDPDLPMWMVFTWSGNVDNLLGYSNRAKSAITAVNGYLITCGDPDGIHIARFVHDDGIRYTHVNHVYTSDSIANRTNTTYRMISNNSQQLLVAATCNDIAATVLPNAPIDEVSGLPVPTIAVATDGGISVIKHNNTVISTSGSSYIHEVEFTDDHGLNAIISNTGGANWACVYVNDFDTLNGLSYGTYNNWDGVVYRTKYDPKALTYKTASTNDTISGFIDLGNRSSAISVPAIGGGLTLFEKSPKDSFDPDSGMVAFIATDYNTGYLHGDIKGAFLSDIDIEDNVELVTNGTFNTNTTGWTVNGGGSVTVSSGQAQMTNNGTTNCSLDQSVTTVVGKTYEVSATITPQGGGPLPRLYVGSEFVQVGSNANSAQTVTLTYVATSTSTLISVNANTNVNNAVTIFDNVTMKLTNDVKGSELHPNGNSNFSSTDVSYISNSASGTATVTSNQLVVSGGSSGYSDHIITVNTEVGAKYVISIDYVTNNGNNGSIGMYVNGGYLSELNDNSGYIARSTGKTYTWYFTADATTENLDLVTAGSTSNTYTFDNWTIKKVEEDRSVNNNGLQVFGTVAKSAVATGADLVSYGPFSASNRLRQPYNSDLNVETNDFSIMFWMYNTGTNSHQTLVSRDDREFDVSILDNSNYSRRFRIYGEQSGNTSNSFDSNDDPFPLNTWSHVCVNYTGGNTVSIYVDGVLNKSGTLNYDIDDTSHGLNIGARNTSGSYAHPADGTKLTLVRISKSAPSAAQVKKMYEDEKVLFQENAICTLDGTSDAVNALAFDDTTKLLHVGTSTGRNDFQGLRRINKTTTAVATAISASDDLIAEQ